MNYHFYATPIISLLLYAFPVNTASAEKPKGIVLSTAKVVYATAKDGAKKTGTLSIIMTKGSKINVFDGASYKGDFVAHLDMGNTKQRTTPLSPLCLPLTGGDKLIFPQAKWSLVSSDFNNDGISEFNLGQSGNSWGGHFMLFTFTKDGKVKAMQVDEKKEFNYLHPQADGPSTTELVKTKDGFRYLFTERGNIHREVYIHYRWNPKKLSFEEFKRVQAPNE